MRNLERIYRFGYNICRIPEVRERIMPSAVVGQTADNPPASLAAKNEPPRAEVTHAAAPAGRWSLSYRASLILSLSLLVVATGLALTFLSFHTARDTTNELAEALFQEVSDHAVTK